MSEMVERVARAIAEAGGTHNVPWKLYEAQARAAIRAIGEPTEDVMDAGCADYLNQERNDFRRIPWNGRRMLRAMVEAALK